MPKRRKGPPAALPELGGDKPNAAPAHDEIMELLDGYPDKDVLALVEETARPDECGDTLFAFLYREAHDSGGDPEEYAGMCLKAIAEIEAVLEHLNKKYQL